MDAYPRKLYAPPRLSHKGQNGKLLVIGGSRRYHGAPVFSLLAARRFVDLLHFYPGENDQHLIHAVKRIPDVMVLDSLKATAEMDCVLFGIGLAEARFDVDFVLEYARSRWFARQGRIEESLAAAFPAELPGVEHGAWRRGVERL